MKTAAAVLVLLVLPGVKPEDRCVVLRVRPAFMLAGKGNIDLIARVRQHDDHRRLEIEWDADERGNAGAWREDLDGRFEEITHPLYLRDQPAANYTFTATVRDGAGKITGRDTAFIRSPDHEREIQ